MSEVKRYGAVGGVALATDGLLKLYPGMDLFVRVSDYDAAMSREAALREELSKLADDYCEKVDDLVGVQQRLTVAEQRVGELECFSVKQAALLDELGIPLDEVDDLFGETLKNARRYEYLRSVMAIENFPDPHPEWSEPSEVESKRIDDLCDAALKPAAEQWHICKGCGSKGWAANCAQCVPY